MNKICTSPEQSRRLIELCIDVNTADMWWAERYKGRTTMDFQYIVDEEPYYYLSFIKPSNDNYSQDTIKDIPAWSLTALLDILPSSTLDSSDNHRYRFRCMERYTEWYDNAIDACVAMIESLHELKIL